MQSPISKGKYPLIALVGPTAVGKTETSLELAERINAEIVSADSRLFYIGMDIGTAKPSIEERARIPHHLIDVAKPNEIWSLAVFQKEANAVIARIHERGHIPLLVGGTGQYIRAILEGWDIPEVKPDPALRQVLENWNQEVTPPGLHHRLALLDPIAAEKIDPLNVRRTIRALEVIFTTGELFSKQRNKSSSPYDTLLLGLYRPREELYKRIDDRIDAMFKAGLVAEVQHLLDQGYPEDLPTMSAIGYRQVISFLKQDISFEESVRLIKRQTRIFVRRQANWFKQSDPDIHWVHAGSDAVSELERITLNWLADL